MPSLGNSISTNSDVIAILMDITNYPGSSSPTANANYQKNPQQTLFLNAKLVSNTNLPGVGPDLVYRDPWKNPYIITMDLNADNQCKDAFYSLHNVSYQNPQPTRQLRSRVTMVWSIQRIQPVPPTISSFTAT